jgi:hypothetical protein
MLLLLFLLLPALPAALLRPELRTVVATFAASAAVALDWRPLLLLV